MRQALFLGFLAILLIVSVLTYESLRARPGPLGDPFILVDSNGNTVTEADIRAKPALLFFGYTMCPDICPTTLFELAEQLERLGDKANKIGVWFFTVDPERDTAPILHNYIRNFSDKIIGVTGNPDQIHAFIKSLRITAIKINGNNGEYTYDHTAAMILLNKGGTLRTTIPYQEQEAIITKTLTQLIESAE